MLQLLFFIVPFLLKCVLIEEIKHYCSAANYMSMSSCLRQGQKLTRMRNDSTGKRHFVAFVLSAAVTLKNKSSAKMLESNTYRILQ